jgi:hypothetical protein
VLLGLVLVVLLLGFVRVRVTAGVRPKVRAKVGAWCLQLARFVVR